MIDIVHEGNPDIEHELKSLENWTSTPVLSDEMLNAYIQQIPAMPKTLESALTLLDENDLQGAAKVVEEDPALSFYLRTQVNKSHILRHQIEDIRQVFSTLGIIPARQFLLSYMINFLCTESWDFFTYTHEQFGKLQIRFLDEWNKILAYEGLEKDRELALVGILLPAVFVVCDQIFAKRAEEIRLMQQLQHLDCNALMQRLVGMSLFQLAGIIGHKWNLPKRATKVVLFAEGENEPEFEEAEALHLGRYLHLLIFYILSRPEECESNMLGFCFFNSDFIDPVREPFQKMMGIDDEA